METVSNNNCNCGANAPVKTIIPTATIKPYNDTQKDLANIIKAVHIRKSKTYKTRLRSPL